VSNNIGFLLTTQNLYAYKPLTNRWTTSAYAGSPCGQDAEGSTIAFWTTQKCYATAMIWNIWHSYSLQNGEVVLGGGSAGMFAIFWTNQRAIAYNGGSGQWTSQSLSSAALGGIASEELGVVWTTQNVYSYSYALRIWKSIAMRNPFVSGSGNTAVSRNSTHAFSYSRTLDTWYPFTPGMCIQGGTADGDVAVVYTKTIAYAFSQFTGNWYPVPLVSAP
jgi:hypothetical protein